MPFDSKVLQPDAQTVSPIFTEKTRASWAIITCEQSNAGQIRVIGRSQARNANGTVVSPAPTTGGKLLANGESMTLWPLGNSQPYELSEVYVVAEDAGGTDTVGIVWGSN